MRRQRSTPRDRGVYEDKPYVVWLRTQPGRSPDGPTPAPSIAHHARHDEHGASLGAHVKDDRRAISMSVANHGHLHRLTGPFDGWTREQLQAWTDAQIAEQRGEWERLQTRLDAFPA
jgi:hypothetical protein